MVSHLAERHCPHPLFARKIICEEEAVEKAGNSLVAAFYEAFWGKSIRISATQ